ncbi:MFS transporter [Coxiella-like endosymbiont of Rhipicephalus sanguineus]|uniref:MFS transporter n=1 Tax=Coxiella-like endosymbiont of Rhipicephalus sanguineus TaxID=1955402 RepID=UPI00203DBE81|nr:MFS transporter [Coxiella-like endosymbiont of Rhipicephalus sanguineus]
MGEPALAVSMMNLKSITYDYSLQLWVVYFTGSVFFFFEFVQLNMFNALGPNLMRAFHIGASCLGHLSANYSYANIIFLFPGMLLNRVSTQKVIILAITASVVCTFGFAASTSIWQANPCRFITGIVGSCCLLSNVCLASRWFEPRQMALVIRLIVTLAMIGGMVAQTPFTLLTDALGWRMYITRRRFFRSHNALVDCLISERFPSGSGQSFPRASNVFARPRFLASIVANCKKNSQNLVIRWGLYSSLMNLPIVLLGAM